MKTFADKLRETPTDCLKEMIQQQKQTMEIERRDLELMEKVLKERSSK